MGIEYFVGGAMARIVMLEHVFGNAAGRATQDIGIGICVANWHLHEAFKQSLVDSGHFDRVPKSAHTLIYRTPLAGRMQLDVIPFGDIERPAARIAWPPDMDTVMYVAGFREASLAAVLVEVDTNLCVPFASLPALAILKLLAWNDRHHDSKRDATDFLILLNSYANAGNLDRLYEQEAGLPEAHGYDIDLAAAALLAKDALGVAGHEARNQIHGTLKMTIAFSCSCNIWPLATGCWMGSLTRERCVGGCAPLKKRSSRRG
jgi:predicted nucleotidyltransferase